MFYALGSVGAFAQGARKRRNEIRSERAAIRDEFERWKANNPNATAMDFHAKVKQLGATTPGGSVALPDASSIQRMAAENLRRKQEAEADRARKLRVDNLNMANTESAFLREQINSGVDVDEALRKTGMELSPENFALAKGIKANFEAEQAQKEDQLAQAKYDREFKQEQALYQFELSLKGQNPFMTDQDARRIVTERFGQSPRSPATAQNTYGPMPTSSAPSAPMSVGNAGVQIAQRQFEEALPTLFENNPGKYAGPNGYEMLKRDAVQLAQREGSTLPPAQIAQALEATNFVRLYDEGLDDTRFNAALEGDEPSSLSITVGEGKNAIPISLKDIYESQLNNGGVLDSRVIPFDKLDAFQAIVAPFFSLNKDGTADLTPLTNMGNQLAGLKGQLDQAGIFDKSELATLREQAVLNEGQAESGAALLDGQRKELEGVVAEVKAQLAAAGSLYEQQQILAQQKVRMDYFKSLTLNDRIAEIYANGGVYPLDVLPASMHSSYDRQAFASTFDDAYESMLAFGRENAASVMVSSEANEAAEQAKLQDVALGVMQAEFGDEQVESVLELVVPTARRENTITSDEVGRMQFNQNAVLPDTPLVEALTNETIKSDVAKAVAASIDVFNSFRDDSGLTNFAKNKSSLAGVLAGWAQNYIDTNWTKPFAPFPRYNDARIAARSQFKATVELIPSLDAETREALVGDFTLWLRQSTQSSLTAMEVGKYANFNNPSRVEGFETPRPSQGLPSGARIIQR
jgi:hypothetical protein